MGLEDVFDGCTSVGAVEMNGERILINNLECRVVVKERGLKEGLENKPAAYVDTADGARVVAKGLVERWNVLVWTGRVIIGGVESHDWETANGFSSEGGVERMSIFPCGDVVYGVFQSG